MRPLVLLFCAAFAVFFTAGCASELGEEEDVAVDEEALAEGKDDFYVIAHMTNTPEAVRWAAREGANAVEIDVRFDEDDGAPSAARHGGLCDCVCSLGNEDHVCAALERDCEASSPVPDLLAAIAGRPELALVVVDSKIDARAPTTLQRAAGARMVDTLSSMLFGRGYRGKVVVGAASTGAVAYVRAVAEAAGASRYRARISVGFDETGKRGSDAACTLDTLRPFAARRAFGAGISACATGDFTPAIREAAEAERGGASGLTYAWTLDAEPSMRRYIEAGARGIITNKPRKLAEVARAMGKAKARPETVLARARANDRTPTATATDACGCDCDYRPGGCAIARPAPPGRACKCEMAGPWRCRGRVTECANRSSPACVSPDTSPEACALGGGDCEGYGSRERG